jgi:hypothetical protein
VAEKCAVALSIVGEKGKKSILEKRHAHSTAILSVRCTYVLTYTV